MASEETENLAALRFSASLAGVELTVVGLGQPYADYSAKVHRYNEYLQGMVSSRDAVEDSSLVTEDDVIVMLDAYDVLLLPGVRAAGKVIPMVFSIVLSQQVVIPSRTQGILIILRTNSPRLRLISSL